MKTYSLILVLVFCLFSCESEQKKETSPSELKQSELLALNYFEKDFNSMSSESFSSDLEKLKLKYTLLFYTNQPDKIWLERYQNSDLKALSDTLNLCFESNQTWQTELHTAFKNYQKSDKTNIIPELILWNSIFEMQTGALEYDDIVLIGMEHYLGENHPFYSTMARYRAKQKDINYLPTDVMLAIADSKLNNGNSKQDFLNQMIAEGKKTYFAHQLLDYDDESKIFKYNETQLDWANANEAEIWTFFIKQDYLYSTDKTLVSRFLADAPFSKFGQEFDQESPGRIATWIGFKIVESYMENNTIPLNQLMSQQSLAQEFLQASKYKP